ncbi:ornithine cyclodeaminase family protein [Streptococcus massiliensis]|uniref:Ornithine cyclodeaminase n=1 Tax=Streptococcus massiliensis TaxID=313439 RepID=A0A380L1D1_9STRE|nr:ornithine cyclodeaminase family protein [Streptococcus massiliensis]SUN77036.1 ornithine cyclodeaminase [Streptococcus massiliensis]
MFYIKILNREDIKEVLEMESVIAGVESVYRLKSNGNTEVWPTVFYDFEPGKADMDIKSGLLKGANLYGHKTVTWFKDNQEKGLPQLIGVIVVYDATTGQPLGILDATYITGVRTGAAGAIGAKYLAKKDAKTLFILGAGNQASNQIAAILSIFDSIEKVFVADVKNPSKAQDFVAGIQKRLWEEFKIDASKVLFENVTDMASSVADSDIIITVTPSREPIIKKEWVKPGTHLSCIGADMAGKEEIDPEILKEAKIYVDDKVHCLEVGEIEIPIKTGVIQPDDIIGEIGDLMEGKCVGRENDTDITVFDATGMALLDIVTAKTALDLAEKKHLGISTLL